MYSLIKPLLFKLDPEKAHDVTMSGMRLASNNSYALSLLRSLYANSVPDLPVECMGLKFNHPVGLAAGLDKNAVALSGFSALGFSAVELGTVTPQPQSGNDKPRMFRLPEDQAIVNRMGFNSAGLDVFLENLDKKNNAAVVGINIGKNAVTPIEDAKFDYLSALQRVYTQADYITVNISSPNTKSLRDLQNAEYLDELLGQIKQAQARCEKTHKKYVPIALKVAPDLSSDEIETIAELLLSHEFDALIVSNTTVSRPESLQGRDKSEQGGLSGLPVKELSTECIRQFYRHLNGQVSIIGVGGIATAEDAWQKLIAGADYLQVYSALIYRGPKLVAEIVTGLKRKLEDQGYENLATALEKLRG